MMDTGKHGPARIYEAEDIRVSLTLAREESDAADHWTLRGTMADWDTKDVSAPSTAHLLLHGRQSAEYPIDHLGKFMAEGLAAGTYDLELRLASRLVALEDLPVGAASKPAD